MRARRVFDVGLASRAPAIAGRGGGPGARGWHGVPQGLYEIMGALVRRRETIEILEASLEEKGKIERDDAMEKDSLEDALEEERETRASLEEKLENFEESHNDIIAKIIKERDCAHAKYKVFKMENARLNDELVKLEMQLGI